MFSESYTKSVDGNTHNWLVQILWSSLLLSVTLVMSCLCCQSWNTIAQCALLQVSHFSCWDACPANFIVEEQQVYSNQSKKSAVEGNSQCLRSRFNPDLRALSVWCLHVHCVTMWVYSECSGFHPHLKDMLVHKLIGYWIAPKWRQQ